MELLIKRDSNILKKTEGKAFADSGVPSFLQVPRVVPQDQVEFLKQRGPNDDLLIQDENDFKDLEEHLDGQFEFRSDFLRNALKEIMKTAAKPIYYVNGLWSGYRSALVRDTETKKWFRLKGIALNPEKPVSVHMSHGFYRIQGGQEKYSAEFEQQMSDRFNGVLESVGIEPNMRVKGIWEYPKLARKTRPAASIVEVKGDTRLDELMFIIDRLAAGKYSGRVGSKSGKNVLEFGGYTSLGFKFDRGVKNLYLDIGIVVGRLKRLMDDSGQTWSSDYEQSNAHIGNIVLYNGADKLRVGFVDFDASCDVTELSRSELKAIQKRECEILRQTALTGPISPRQITGKSFAGKFIISSARQEFINGFNVGYESDSRKYTNEVELGLEELQEVFTVLREEGFFTFAPQEKIRKYTAEESFNDGFYKLRNRISLSDIIKSQYNYQKSRDYNDTHYIINKYEKEKSYV